LSAAPALAGGHGLVADAGFEAALAGELRAARAGLDGPRWPALLTARGPLPAVDPAFALQQLPAVTRVEGDSVGALAEAALAAADLGARGDGPFTLHAAVPEPRSYRSIAGRAALVGEAFLQRLRAADRHAWKAHRPWREAAAGDPAWAATWLVQLVLVGRRSLLVSAARPRPLPGGGLDLAPWPGGRAPVAEDRRAPSRAYRKLREGLAWLGAAPRAGETCVDLGGAPGGWAHVALTAGARVLAVDRAPLAPALLAHPDLQMVTGNAFTYTPPAPVDWLLCDVICEPHRTIDLVDSWMREARCRQVVATLKFKGDKDYPAIADAHARLSRHRWPFVRIKHLAHHHNEAAILARAA
jgi:23S rRNA (cytidine2498-2'-O)-methyltransferase